MWRPRNYRDISNPRLPTNIEIIYRKAPHKISTILQWNARQNMYKKSLYGKEKNFDIINHEASDKFPRIFSAKRLTKCRNNQSKDAGQNIKIITVKRPQYVENILCETLDKVSRYFTWRRWTKYQDNSPWNGRRNTKNILRELLAKCRDSSS